MNKPTVDCCDNCREPFSKQSIDGGRCVSCSTMILPVRATEPPEPSIAFTAGQKARRMKIPIRQSALRKLRPGSRQYDDFIDGYETPLRKQK